MNLILSLADAKTFCIAASQIIPALLIALFVIDRNLTDFNYDEYAALERDIDKLLEEIQENRRELEKARKFVSESEDELRKLSDRISHQHTPRRQILRLVFAYQMRKRAPDVARTKQEVDQLENRIARALESETGHKDRLTRIGRIAKPRLIRYRMTVAGVTIIALTGEVASILGSLSALGLRKSVFVSVLSIAVVTGFIAWAMISRFLDDLQSSRTVRIARLAWWGFVVFLVTLAISRIYVIHISLH